MKKLVLLAVLLFATTLCGTKLCAEQNSSHQVGSDKITVYVTAVKDFFATGKISFETKESGNPIVFYPMLLAVISLILMILAHIFFEKNYLILPAASLLITAVCSLITAMATICVLSGAAAVIMFFVLLGSFYASVLITDVMDKTPTNTNIFVFFCLAFFLLFFMPVSFVFCFSAENELTDMEKISSILIASAFCFTIAAIFAVYNLSYYVEGDEKMDGMAYIIITRGKRWREKKRKLKICKGYTPYFIVFYLMAIFHITSLLYF